jgi:hypothetical protein
MILIDERVNLRNRSRALPVNGSHSVVRIGGRLPVAPAG